MKIGIIGYGYVGKAMDKFFKRKHETLVYDPLHKDESIKKTINECCEMAVLCVPTPMKEDGSCDLQYIESTFEWLRVELILIKSTIPPGTVDLLKEKYGKRIVFSPEYIGEGNYYVPPQYMHPTEVVRHPFQIFGGDEKDTSDMISLFVPIMGPHVFFYQTDAKTAEMIKYMENAWGAMKVTFANEMFECCGAVGIDYWKAREGWLLDNRTEKMHTAVFQNKRGFGGKCFPKDVNALVRFSERAGYEPKLIKEVLASNNRFRMAK
jgi:UDPglucose 6-dehydrogenase